MVDKEKTNSSTKKKEANKKKCQTELLEEQVATLTAKVKELEQQIAQKETILAEANEKYLRLVADYDNYRKRREKEVSQIIEYAGEEVLRNILPILDDLERAYQNANPESNEQNIRDGLELIYRKFGKILKDLGVEAYESLHQPFNPDLHYAVMQREEPETPSETVVAEFEKGYKYRNRVLRHAKVVVSK